MTVLETGETAAAWCLSWGSMISNFCIPGLVRIPNHVLMGAFTPHFVFSPLPTFASICFHFRSQEKTGSLLWIFLASTALPLCTVCLDWFHGCANPLALSKAAFFKRTTCQHESGLRCYTANMHWDKLRAAQSAPKRRKKGDFSPTYNLNWKLRL